MDVQLEWMPAHTAEWQVGVAREGNGSKLTTRDRTGNDIADEFAKKGAKLDRVPKWIKDKVEQA